jgi:hypothetical protein
MEATLFVFYAPRDPRARWTNAGLPAGWWHVGKGARFPVDEQFCGPAATAGGERREHAPAAESPRTIRTGPATRRAAVSIIPRGLPFFHRAPP